MLLNAVPDGFHSPADFLAVNVDDKKAIKGDINPIAVVANLVPTLKIGDRIKIDLVYLGQTRWIKNVTLLPKDSDSSASSSSSDPDATSSTDAPKGMQFKVRGLTRVRTAAGPAMALRVTKGRLSWTMLLPNVPNPDAGKGKPDKVADPKLLALLKQFLPGEPVMIDYETVGYAFVIKDVHPVVVSGSGRVINAGERKIYSGRLGIKNVECPQTTVYGVGGTRCLVIRPADATNDQLPAGASGLAATVKGLQKDQVVQYKYYMQGGVRWLIEAGLKD